MKRLALFLLLSSVVNGVVNAAVINFTEVFPDPPPSYRALVGDEWSPFGITIASAYWYADTRDPFDMRGLANGATFNGPSHTAVINFTVPTLSVTVDWMSLQGYGMNLEAYTSGGTLVDSLSVGARSTDISGTTTLSGGLIESLQWEGEGFGTATISTLSFTMIPEPSALGLAILGASALLLIRYVFSRRQGAACIANRLTK